MGYVGCKVACPRHPSANTRGGSIPASRYQESALRENLRIGKRGGGAAVSLAGADVRGYKAPALGFGKHNGGADKNTVNLDDFRILHWLSPALRWCRAFSGRVRSNACPVTGQDLLYMM